MQISPSTVTFPHFMQREDLWQFIRLFIPMLTQINPVHALPTKFFKFHVNIVLQSMPRSHTGIESHEKQATIPPPIFLSQYSRVNCFCTHYEYIWGSEAIAPIIFNFCSTCRRMVSSHSSWVTPHERASIVYWMEDLVDPRAGLGALKKGNSEFCHLLPEKTTIAQSYSP